MVEPTRTGLDEPLTCPSPGHDLRRPEGRLPRYPPAGGAFLTLATAGSSLLRAAFLVLAGRLLGPEHYAELYAALSLVFLLGTGLTPMGSAIAHFTSLYSARGELGKVAALRRQMPRRLAVGSAALLLLGAAAALPVRSVLGFESLATPLLITLILALTLQLSSPRGLLRGMALFRSYGLNLLAESVLRLGVAVPLLLAGATATSGLFAYALGALAALVLGHLQVAPVAGEAKPEAADPRPLERMLGPLLIFALLTAAFQNLDMLFVKRFFPALAAGHYAAASSVAKLTALAFLPFSVANLPLFTAALARGKALGPVVLRAVGGYLALAGATLGALALWGPQILHTLYGEAFAAAAEWLLPLAFALTLGFVSATLGQAFCAARRYGFLWLMGATLALEIAVLLAWRPSLDALPSVLVAVQALNLALLTALFLARPPEGLKV